MPAVSNHSADAAHPLPSQPCARTLRHGKLSFSALEQGDGPLVLCLHGFPDHARSYRLQLPALAQAGFWGVAPMLRGYEPRSQPSDGDYHPLRMAEDVIAWIDQLGAQRFHLVGHDWGAIIGYLVAAIAPERLLSLTTLAVPHPGRMLRELLLRRPSQLLRSWYVLLFRLRGVAERALERDDWALIERLYRAWSPSFQLPVDELAALKQTFGQPGVERAALSYYRASFFSPAARATSQLLAQPLRVPTLALTGGADGCLDTRLHDDFMHESDFPEGLRVVRLMGAGHFLHQEKPTEVNRLMLAWLKLHGAARASTSVAESGASASPAPRKPG
jgi:pimeloyl-ACP methyl ester carboxylesterase